jgi:hypothetical protein
LSFDYAGARIQTRAVSKLETESTVR